MPYLQGVLTTERVIRPGMVEELLRLEPQDGTRAVIFDLEDSLLRMGLCEFIRECEASKARPTLGEDGRIIIPENMVVRFEFYREFYGLGTEVLQPVELLKAQKKSSSATGSADDGGSMKKLDLPEGPAPKAPKKGKISKKLEPKNLNIVPAGIMFIAEGSAKGGPTTAGTKPLGPSSLSSKLGAQCVGVKSFGLGKAATSIKSIGGPSMGNSRR